MAWLMIDGTSVNYPVAQGEDNTWFLNRNYKGEFATAGSLFLDSRNKNDFSDTFSIIYGHRMGNGEMFSDIQKYKSKGYFAAHKSGILRLEKQDIALSIMAYAEIEADDWDIYNVERSGNQYAETALSKVLESSVWRDGDIKAGSRYVLLSTCDGMEKNKRDVLLVKILP